MSSIFDFDILNEAASDNITPTLENMSDNLSEMKGSYFSQTIDFLIDYNHEFTEATKSLYRSVLESGGDDIYITESFADFKNKVKKIIDKFLAFMKSLFQRFITNLNSMFKSEKYLKNHENDFKKFSTEHEFEFMGYNFTIDPDIPLSDAESEWIGDDKDWNFSDAANFKQKYDELENAEENKKRDANNNPSGDVDYTKVNASMVKELKDKYQKLTDYLKDEYYDTLRAKLIGKDGEKIYESDFSNELFCVFRDGYSDKESIEVTSSYINETLLRFKGYEKQKQSVERTRREIEKSYENIKKDIDTMTKISGSGDNTTISFGIDGTRSDAASTYGAQTTFQNVNKEIATQVELYEKAKINQVQQMSNIHSLAFAAKLDAMKDMLNQDKTVLYKALYRIQGVAKKEN